MQTVIERPSGKWTVSPRKISLPEPRPSKPAVLNELDPLHENELGTLHELVCGALQSSPYRSLRGVACQWQSGTARLTGRVPSYYMKQLAQETVRKVEGVQRVLNLVVVVDRDQEEQA